MVLIKSWLQETGSVTSITDLAELLGFSAAKMYSVMHLTGVPLTIAEFAMVCEHFGKDPTEQCMKIFEKCGYDLKQSHAPLLREAAGGRRLGERIQEALNAYLQETGRQREETPPPRWSGQAEKGTARLNKQGTNNQREKTPPPADGAGRAA
ncbi:hypothetical protein [Bifidobacterium sp. A11]|uniref:hypothetical protein n=1 Tax=Bifidobacterium sp. A11 TaxID=1394176 RepID=UPI000427831D|nr:hypothetical protein [Bifidobacterium sp. A11]